MSDGAPQPFRALEQRRTFEKIIVQIEEAILTGQLQPGDRLPAERELAETFGASRASVREALRVLEMFGAVVARRGTGPERARSSPRAPRAACRTRSGSTRACCASPRRTS